MKSITTIHVFLLTHNKTHTLHVRPKAELRI